MPLVKCRTVKRYFAGGKGYSTAWQAYRGLARKELRHETEVEVWRQTPTPRSPCWFIKEPASMLGDGGMMLESPGAYTIEHRRKYRTNAEWQKAINQRAEELRAKDEATS
jgi:hypothetical protein